MALWGNKDNLNIGGIGTVYVSDWDTNTVTGSGYTTSDSSFKEPNSDYTKAVYAVNADNIDATGLLSPGPGAGWVGVTTYMGSDGELRVKSEILVAASGIATGGRPKFPTPLDLA
jgi:hypothetical protein